MSLQWDDPKNRALAPRLRQELNARGLTFGVWEAFPKPGSGAKAVTESGAQHYIAQAEQPEPWPEIVSTFRAALPTFPAAVVTTFWGCGATATGYDRSIPKPLIDGDFACLTEAYVNQSGTSVSPARLDWTAKAHLGWERTQPTIGVYWDYPAERYINEFALAEFPGYWVWLAETMNAFDWSALKEFNS